jgi:glycosyltransferase involved in cell wall biosynthesis
VRISILVHNVYGVGGTNRTVINLAEELSRQHRVEIVSVLRRLDRPMLAVPARIPVVGLVDLRSGSPDVADPRRREVSEYVPAEEEFSAFYNRLTDERVGHYLRHTSSNVVVGTRSALNLYLARLGRPDTVRVAQEHMTQDMIPGSVHEEMRRYYPRLSAVTAVTESDARAVRELLGPGAPPVLAIPNSVPEPRVARADSSRKIVVAAGRLDEIKRYDLLVRAFAKVVAERPDWTLRIYGSGGMLRPLATLIADLELHNHVRLMGAYSPIEAEWVKGSIAAVTSDKESFGMTIVEAMRCGVPVVSTACPVGPAEIIEDGVDGLLVPPGDVDAIAGALLRLMNDEPLRTRLGAAALDSSRRYDPALIAARYAELFANSNVARGPLVRRTAARLRDGRRALVRIMPGRPERTGAAPVADCRTEGNRAVVTTADPVLPGNLTDLVLRPRRIEPKPKQVHLPLSAGPAGWSATFPLDEPLLAEGRWDLFAADRRGGLHRLRAGLLDVRGLLGGCAESAPFARNVPYPTADGFLAVAAWQRDLHAEADQIWFGHDTVTVTGRLIAATFGDATPMVTLTRRGEHPGTLTVAGETGGGADFRVDIPLPRLAALRLMRYEDWDVSVGIGPDGPVAAVARLMDDMVERKKVFRYPSARVDEEVDPGRYDEWPRPEVRIRPYLALQSGLSFVVTDRPT